MLRRLKNKSENRPNFRIHHLRVPPSSSETKQQRAQARSSFPQFGLSSKKAPSLLKSRIYASLFNKILYLKMIFLCLRHPQLLSFYGTYRRICRKYQSTLEDRVEKFCKEDIFTHLSYLYVPQEWISGFQKKWEKELANQIRVCSFVIKESKMKELYRIIHTSLPSSFKNKNKFLSLLSLLFLKSAKKSAFHIHCKTAQKINKELRQREINIQLSRPQKTSYYRLLLSF